MVNNLTRRKFLMSTAVTGSAAYLSLFSTRVLAQDSGTLVISSYGGSYEEAQQEALFNPYRTLNPGLKIVLDSPQSDAKLRAMVESGNVSWDLVIVGGHMGLEADAKWLEPIDYSVVDKSALREGYAGKYRVGADAEATVLSYNIKAYDKTPNSFRDFFDSESFPGPRAAFRHVAGGILEMALIADGVAPSDLYPIDIDRALTKLDTIREQLVWWETGAQSEQLMTSGETPMGQLWIGRAAQAAERAPVKTVWDQWLTADAFWVVPKGATNREAAMKAINYFISPEPQARFSSLIPYGPVNPAADTLVVGKNKGRLPTDHLSTAVKQDMEWWNANLAAMDQRFQAWLIR
ncbi:ABC transporter substrate-binding protein [Mesorhizobium sp. B3-1-3]|uniref:ABC transporter substrate-binding protein n=1 Tax=unclassified Mesorhizobium TaxID=325217 RepID=UPI00112A33DA|nr:MULTISPECIES: ABC transporter substrate-binding protein [unclassified Mesorhizobium]TPI56051.1 ABC transporter substrate-binding protein [Mesorhizobium sp. B3-1-8]TPI63345.1 ABC transporter substrate-binding protein [Mesorhizobium sp. B3-1-3]